MQWPILLSLYDHKLARKYPYYDSRVVIYDRRGFIRLATGLKGRYQYLGVTAKCQLKILPKKVASFLFQFSFNAAAYFTSFLQHKLHRKCWAVWPDVRIKLSPNVPISCPKSSNNSLYFIVMISQISSSKGDQILRLIFMKSCHRRLSKIAQSDHTGVE